MSQNKIINPATFGGCVYYSQNREDLILQSFFPDVKKGFYVDIGAYDPDEHSVTKLFYLKGWRGINIEPQADRCARFDEVRPLDTNLAVGIGSKQETLPLRTYNSQGRATFSTEMKQLYQENPDNDTQSFNDQQVLVRPLADVLAEHKVERVHFMKVDVEGLEYEVLASNDWQRFRPEVLCIEADHILKDWRPMVREAGYELVFDDGLNEYYADGSTGRKKKFNFIRDVVAVRGGGIRADYFKNMEVLYALYLEYQRSDVNILRRENESFRKQVERQKARLDALEENWNSFWKVTKRLRQLLKVRMHNKVKRT